MAKQLREPPPSSSVARLLDRDAAARALAPHEFGIEAVPDSMPRPSVVAITPTPTPQPSGEIVDVKREFVLSRSTDEAFTQLVDLLRRSTGTRLTSSHVARALFRGIAHCLPIIELQTRRLGRLKLPSNARGREAERERFETLLTQTVINGIRASAAYDPQTSPAQEIRGPNA
jgi:hypothetical protein